MQAEPKQVDVESTFTSLSDVEIQEVRTKGLNEVEGPVRHIAALRAKVENGADCSHAKGRLLCAAKHGDLSQLATAQFQAAQMLRKAGLLGLSRPLYAAACAVFAQLHNPTNAALIWDVGLGLQHEGRHQEALDFYAALRYKQGCSPFKPTTLLLGDRLAEVAKIAELRPQCGSTKNLRSGRKRKATSPLVQDRFTWTKELPEFCPVIDMSRGLYSAQHFLDDFVAPSRPAVLRGLPPLPEPFRHSDNLLHGLKHLYGTELVTIFAYPSVGASGSQSEVDERPPLPAEVPMQLQDFVALLERNTSTRGIRVRGEHVNLDRELPKLAESIVQQQAKSLEILAALPFRRANLRLAPVEDEVDASLHYDAHDSLLYQVECGREFLLFPPGDLNNLPYGMKSNDLQWQPILLGESSEDEHVHWERSPTLHGSRTSTQLNLTMSTQLGDALLPRKCTLRAGDAFFLPAFWHQQSDSFAGPNAGVRCGCIEAAVDFWYRPLHTEPSAAQAAAATFARSSEL